MSVYDDLKRDMMRIRRIGEGFVPDRAKLGWVVDGQYTIIDSRNPRLFWVRFTDQAGGISGAALEHRGNVAPIPDLDVLIGKDRFSKSLFIMGIAGEARQVISPTGDDPSIGLHYHDRYSGRSYLSDDRLRLKLRIDAESGLTLKIQPGVYSHNNIFAWFPGGLIDVTSNRPASAGHHAWVVIGIKPQDNTLVAVTGTSQPSALTLRKEQIFETDFDWLNHVPICAVRLSHGQSAAPAEQDYEALLHVAQSAHGNNLVVPKESGLTIASDAVSISQSAHSLTPQTGSADDLKTISNGEEGRVVWLSAASGATITIKHNTGNILLNAETDFSLTSNKRIGLIYGSDGKWHDFGVGSTAGGGGSFTGDIMPSVFDARLTLTTGTPVTTSDVTAATTLYLTPFRGNLIALYDGTDWVGYTLSEISLSLSSLAANTNYDIFVYDSSGLTLEAVAWSSNTTRATALTQQNGIWVKSGAPTRRYAGTIRTLAAGQCEDSVSRRFVFNYWQQLPRRLRVIETANSWTYNTNSFRAFNNSTDNRVEIVIGLNERPVRLDFYALAGNSLNLTVGVGIGLDSTTVNSASIFAQGNNNASAQFLDYVGIGYHYLQLLEIGATLGTSTFYGDAGLTWIQSGGIGEVYA